MEWLVHIINQRPPTILIDTMNRPVATFNLARRCLTPSASNWLAISDGVMPSNSARRSISLLVGVSTLHDLMTFICHTDA